MAILIIKNLKQKEVDRQAHMLAKVSKKCNFVKCLPQKMAAKINIIFEKKI